MTRLIFGTPEANRIAAESRDAAEYPRQTIVTGAVICPACQVEVPLEAETDSWQENEAGRWEHLGYGPGSGECESCGRIFVEDIWNGGAFVLALRKEEKRTDERTT